MSHIGYPRADEGADGKAIVTDWDTQQLLTEIVKQLKVMNVHLALITDNEVKKQEVQ